MHIEVVYALPAKQYCVELDVDQDCTVWMALERSGLLTQCPDIDAEAVKLGIFGVLVEAPRTTLVREGDRVEIYRPLLIDPKVARQQRAAAARSKP